MDRSPLDLTHLPSLVKGLSLAPVVTGLGVLLLWMGGRADLGAFGPDRVPMAPSTALLFCLYGLAIFLPAQWPAQRACQRAAAWILGAGALLALLLGTLSGLGIRLSAEHLGVIDPALRGGGSVPLGHMSPITAASFGLAALAHVTTPGAIARPYRSGMVALGLAALLAGAGLLILLAYLFEVPILYGTAFIPPALLTGLAFLCLAFGLIFRALPHLEFLRDRTRAEAQVGLSFLGAFALIAATILTASFLHFRHFESDHRSGLEEQLAAIAELKVQQLAEYRRERMADVSVLQGIPGIPERVARALQGPPGSPAEHQVRDWMDRLRVQNQYDRIRLVDGQGRPRISVPALEAPLDSETALGVTEVLKSGQLRFLDIYRSDQDQQPYLTLLVPLTRTEAPHGSVGVLVVRIDPQHFLYPFLSHWPGPSRTAETLLVRWEGGRMVFLNPPRFAPTALLNGGPPLGMDPLATALASRGPGGLVEGRDYRGAQVFAALRGIPDSPWQLVTRMDAWEALTPVRARAWQLLGLNLILTLTFATGLAFLWRQQRLRILQAGFASEQARQKAETKFRLIFDEAADGIFQVTPGGRLILANPALAHILGWDSPAELQSHFTDIGHQSYVHPERREEFRRLIEAQGHVTAFEYEIFRRDGSIAWVSETSRAVRNEAGGIDFYEGRLQDITERRLAEEAQQLSAAHLRTLIDTIPDLVWMKDTEGVYLECNRRFERFFAAREQDILGKTDYDFVDRELADFFREHDQKAMAAGVPTTNEEEITFADDGHREHLETIKTPIFGVRGEILGVLGIGRDITARKQAELARLEFEKQALHEQRVESLGVLAGGIAHDFNNILTSILGNAELALSRLSGGEPYRRNLENIQLAGSRAKDLIQKILLFSQQVETHQEPVQVALAVEESVKLLRAVIPSTINIRVDVDTAQAAVLMDPIELHQVIMNLSVNAAHAMRRDVLGTLSIAAHHRAVNGQNRIELTLGDTGSGIPPEILNRIFEPFYTTKGVDGGTGLGLSVVHGIVQRAGGSIEVESELGKGSRFRILLPLALGPGPATHLKGAEEESGPLQGRILLVDDEPAIREMLSQALVAAGGTLVCCADGQQALQTLLEDAGGFDAVISDLTMPRMTGLQLAQEVARNRPGLPFVLMTGISLGLDQSTLRAAGIAALLLKPVFPSEVVRTLRALIGHVRGEGG
jgi:PAS domain S-box-containing protein